VTANLCGLMPVFQYHQVRCFFHGQDVFKTGKSRPCLHNRPFRIAQRAGQQAGFITGQNLLMDGGHDIDRCMEVTEAALNALFDEMYAQRVVLEQAILKPNMVISGKKCATRAGVDEVAEKTIACLKRTVPAAIPGIAFLSGGQSDEEATAHLSAMNAAYDLPWQLSFSYGRALQAAPLQAWGGKSENAAAAQAAFAHRARMNSLAATGKWSADLERSAA